MRHCQLCQKEIRKTASESRNQYAMRKFCGQPCSKKARQLNPHSQSPYRVESVIARKAATLAAENEGWKQNNQLNPDRVRKIRELGGVLGFSPKEVSLHMNVSIQSVNNVLNYRSWRHVV